MVVGLNLSEKVLLRFCHAPREMPMVHYDPACALDYLSRIFPEFLESVRDREVIDFGCGLGYQVAALGNRGVKRVIGIEQETCLAEQARLHISRSGLEQSAAVCPGLTGLTADFIVCQNSFEHFVAPEQILAELKSALRPEGRIIITFGPLWFTPAGSHMGFFCSLPWVNLLFPESTVMAVRRRYRDDGARTYEEAGLARMSLAKFERVVPNSGLRFEWKKYDCVKRLQPLRYLPGLREVFVNRVSCILTH